MDIEEHPDFGDVLDLIEKYGNMNKSDLVNMLGDLS